MIWVINVFTVTVVLLDSRLARSDPLEPIQTLEPMTPRRYAPLKESTLNVDVKGGKPSREESENEIMKNLLVAFDKIRRESGDTEVKDAMELVQLLVTQSWIYTMKPRLSLLRECTNVGPATSLQEAKDHIILEIFKFDSRKPVSNTIIFYKRFVEPIIKEDFLVEAKRYADNNQANPQKIRELDMLHEFVSIAFVMCLQSYVIDFGTPPYQATFEIVSSDGSNKMAFKTPSVEEGNFDNLVNEGDQLQNFAISNYLSMFEKCIKKTKDNNDLNTLTIVKILIIQSWIHTLQPSTDLVEKVVPIVTKEQSLSEIKTDLSNILQQLSRESVEDAIIRYATGLKEKIRKELVEEAHQLSVKLDAQLSVLDGISVGHELYEENINDDIKNLERYIELRGLIDFHDVSENMCLQGYVLDFLHSPYPQTLILNKLDGKSMNFPVPPLGENSFDKMVQTALPEVEPMSVQ